MDPKPKTPLSSSTDRRAGKTLPGKRDNMDNIILYIFGFFNYIYTYTVDTHFDLTVKTTSV